MVDLSQFNTEAMVHFSLALRQMSEQSGSMEAVAQKVVNYLHQELRTPEGEPACALVRFFKTHFYRELETELQGLIQSKVGQEKTHDDLICLTLLATQGSEPQWQDRRCSVGHQVIPLFSPEAIQKIPMIAQLLSQFGLTAHELLSKKSDPHLEKLDQKTYKNFHIEQAAGSEFIPQQTNFVIPYGIQSVIAFGGMLPNGELFAVILFSKVHIPKAIAQLFDPLALSIKLSILPFSYDAVFRSQNLTFAPPLDHAIQALKSEVNTLRQLLTVSEATALRQSHYLEKSIAELTVANQAAEAANIAKSEFLSTVSHEIRTPMNAVIGLTNLLLDTPLNQQQKDFVEIILNSGNDLMYIINDILDFSEIDAGKLELENNILNLRECFEKAINLYIYTAQEKGIELILDWHPETPEYIQGDVTRIRQILTNLLSNAFKFTSKGEIVVSVSVENVEASRAKKINFSVKDTGIGIPPERKNRLFKAFSQVDSSTTRQYGGTGLGLVISERLATLMGGSIWVESAVGRGSTFFCQIMTTSVLAERSKQLLCLPGKQILIVDNSVTVGAVLTRQFLVWGATAIAIQDPQQAIALLQGQHHFDLVILDWQMPELDGISLAIELRKLPTVQHLPLMLLSNGTLPPIEMLRNVDFAAIVNKPVKPENLITQLHQIFNTAPPPASTQSPQPSTIEASIIPEKSALKILIAEDNIVNQKVAVLTLKKLGYQADIASNGNKVIECIGKQDYDVILMDIQMPELDGIQTTEWIRKNHRATQPKIIAMTANVAAQDLQKCLDAGMDDYLTKPILPEHIEVALNKVQAFPAE